MDTPILETERLVFRPFTPDDFDLLAELHSDPEVQRFIGGMWTAEEVQRRLDFYVGQQVERGYSKWKAYLRDGEFVGRAGVSLDLHTGDPELGYSFAQRAWGQGLASEAARAIVDWMWANTDAPELTAFAVAENLASRRVLEKVGMVFEGDADRHGDLCAYYRLKRPS
ncbi:MAG: GNAT family N-acetyltransferase [Phenylobacterium sp.]